ncbi:hypothetical protein BG011_003965 [Mortierella polycephala]|uniref:CCHC-type domain-containing protein n=1 Tax=Mortierella polycephala TaxID=41804 RepID=A0A9P6Q117_9FUNG|nr:hypothetical protein BG011_003965 [Mortierella polycephala]
MSDFQRGLQAFERLVKSDEGVRAGSCKKCGGSGHLTFECRNLIKLDEPAQKPKSNSRFGLRYSFAVEFNSKFVLAIDRRQKGRIQQSFRVGVISAQEKKKEQR